jgi:hypothetical protein
VILGASLLFYTIACALPALEFRMGDRHDTWRGVGVLLLGWGGILTGQFAWFANPFLWLSWLLILLRFFRASALTALVALLLTLNTFELYSHPLPADEGGTAQSYLDRPRVGFFFWIAGICVPLLGGVWLRWTSMHGSVLSATSRTDLPKPDRPPA